MKYKWPLASSLLIVLLLLFYGQALSFDTQIFGRDFSLHGFVQQEAAFSVDPKNAFNNVTDYSSIQLEWSYQITDNIQLYGVNRLLGDLAYDIRHDSGHFRRLSHSQGYKYETRENLQWEWNRDDRGWEFFRELYFDITAGPFMFRLGRQQVVWGETDGIRIMDCINPQDLRREWILRDSDEGYEFTRIPLWLLKGEYFMGDVGAVQDLSLEFIFNPGDIETNRLEAFNSEGGHWAAKEPNLPILVRVGLQNKKPTGIQNAEYSARLKGIWKGFLFTLNFHYGRADDAVLDYRRPSLILPNEGRILQLNFHQEYDRQTIVGFTLNKDLTFIRLFGQPNPVLRVEALYEFQKDFNNDGENIGGMAWTGLNLWEKDGVLDKDQMRYMIGLDWQIYIRALNKRESFFFSLQFIQFRIMNYDDELVNAPFYFKSAIKKQLIPPLPYFNRLGLPLGNYIDPWRVHREQNYWSFLLNTQYFNKRVTPQILYLHDFQENAHGIKAKINFSFGDHWRPEFGWMWFSGDHDTGKSFGLFDKNDQLYMKIKYQF